MITALATLALVAPRICNRRAGVIAELAGVVAERAWRRALAAAWASLRLGEEAATRPLQLMIE